MTAYTVAAATCSKETELVDFQFFTHCSLDAPLDVAGRVIVNLVGRPCATNDEVALHLAAGVIASPLGPYRSTIGIGITLNLHAFESLVDGYGRTCQRVAVVFLQTPVGIDLRTALQGDGCSADGNVHLLVALCDGDGTTDGTFLRQRQLGVEGLHQCRGGIIDGERLLPVGLVGR